ncbi:hypothetical protein V1511DRAFT_499795 [Dipodascopsis uninucleata]
MTVKMLLSLLSLLIIAPMVNCLFTDEANVIDWQIESLGHLSPSNILSSTNSLMVLSDSVIIASLNMENGKPNWRHDLSDRIEPIHFHFGKLGNEGALVVGAKHEDPSVTHVMVWKESDGYLIWENFIPEGAPVDFAISDKIYILQSDGVITALKKSSGAFAFKYDIPKEYSPVGILATNHVISVIVRSIEGIGQIDIDSNGEILSHYSLLDKNPSAISSQKIARSSDAITWSLPGDSTSFKIANVSERSIHTIKVSHSFSKYTVSKMIDGKLIAVYIDTDSKNSWAEVFSLSSDGSYNLETVIEHSVAATGIIGDSVVRVYNDAISVRPLLSSSIETRTVMALPSHDVEFVACGSGVSTNCIIGYKNELYSYVTSSRLLWTIDESTSNAIDAVFIDLEDEGELSSLGEVLFEENASPLNAYIHRVARHLNDLKSLPFYIVNFANRFLSGNYDPVPLLSNSTASDTFGFRKFAVLANTKNSLVALDTAHSGAVAWRLDSLMNGDKIIGLAKTDIKDNIIVVGAFGTVALVDAWNGKILNVSKLDVLEVGDKIDSVFKVSGKIALWTAHSEVLFLESTPEEVVYFSKVVDGVLKGFMLSSGVLTPTWTFSLPTADFTLDTLARRDPEDVTVSVGRVLGDRSVLYKYLNPHLLAVTAVDHSSQSLGVFLLDDVSGRVLYSSIHEDEGIDTKTGVRLVVGEHWVVYSYWSDQPARGEKVVVLDLYESEINNERWTNGDRNFSSFDDTPLPYVQSKAYLFPQHITALAISRSRFGITNRDIIASTDLDQIVVIPKRLLDARRPYKDPTNNDKEEGLIKYDPLIGDDRRFTISHYRKILGVKKIICVPAYLESTSLVLAYGVDTFFTRITPSQPFDVLSKSFNKGQLLLTILALLGGVRATAPMVKRKQLNARWGTSN